MEITPKDIVTVFFGLLSFIALYLVRPAADTAHAAKKTAENVGKELNNYKLHVAERYVTVEQMEKHFDRIEKSIDEIKELVKKQNV